jgi:hypothetical protein
VPLPIVYSCADHGDVTKYKQFTDLYGSEPDPKDQPSLKKQKGHHKPIQKVKNNKLYNNNKARAFIQCSACFKIRVIYVPTENECLTKREKLVIRALEESAEYICGAELTMYKQLESQEANEASRKESTIYLTEEQRAEPNKEFQFYLKAHLTCETPMEEAYFKGQRLAKKKHMLSLWSFRQSCPTTIRTRNERLFLSLPPLHNMQEQPWR